MPACRPSAVALFLFISILFLLCSGPAVAAGQGTGSSVWGANYFPNVPLISHEGKTLHFFDDLIKDKVVMINFIFTRCPDACPLETARLLEVQKILGDRVGKDVFMYSISIDPEYDTPEVLNKYVEQYRIAPGWLFLTGKESDIILLRKKLGLYIEEIQSEDSTDHNLNLIVGNQSTGRWMKSSPFENPYVLATQVGSWLHNWKLPPKGNQDYSEAPELRTISKGESLFRTRCSACHTIGADPSDATTQGLGPDLFGVIEYRDRAWLERWLAEPDRMIEEKDPLAMALLAKYNNLPMPNLRLKKVEIEALLSYIEEETKIKKAKDHHSDGHDHHGDGHQ